MTQKDLARFIKKVNVPTDANEEECWIWNASRLSNGYGNFKMGVRTVQAHRAIYEHCYGEIPEDYVIHHACEIKLCVNIYHLRCVTRQQNAEYAAPYRMQTHCRRGHEFTEENIYWFYRPNGKLARSCHLCRILNSQEYRLSKIPVEEMVDKLTDGQIAELHSRMRPNGTA